MSKENSSKNIFKEQVFKELFMTYSKDLHDFLYYKFGENHAPQDVTQIAFQKLWENCTEVSYEKAKSYLFTVANNEMLNAISRRKTVLNYRQHKPKDYTVETPEFLLEESEYHDRLQKAIEELTEEQRVAFLLNRIEGKKHQEIAEMLGISRKAVEKRIYKALRILQEKVEFKKFGNG